MKIAVVGSGAMGGCLGSLLQKGGNDVTFVDIKKDHVAAMQNNGLIVRNTNGEEEVLKVKATTDIETAGTPELIVFAVKSYDNEQAAKDCLKIVGPETIVVTVQNGVGNVEVIGEVLSPGRIIAGTTAYGSTLLEPGKIMHSATGAISIGELDGSLTPRLQNVVDVFANAGVEMHTTQNVDSLIWTKLMVNVGINALGAITLLTNGQLLDYEETKSLQEGAVLEGAAVAKAKGIEFMVNDIVEYVRGVSKSTYHNKASMRQDVEQGNKTEVLAINGAIVREGKKLEIATPINDTLTKLVRAIEQRGKI